MAGARHPCGRERAAVSLGTALPGRGAGGAAAGQLPGVLIVPMCIIGITCICITTSGIVIVWLGFSLEDANETCIGH